LPFAGDALPPAAAIPTGMSRSPATLRMIGLKMDRATHGPQAQAGRGHQRSAEAANSVAGQENTVAYELFPS